MLPKPDFYTEEEGGKWKKWYSTRRFDLQWLSQEIKETASGQKYIIAGPVVIHSLLFGDWKNLKQSIRWDCVNGFSLYKGDE